MLELDEIMRLAEELDAGGIAGVIIDPAAVRPGQFGVLTKPEGKFLIFNNEGERDVIMRWFEKPADGQQVH
jgi:hypothetical protein